MSRDRSWVHLQNPLIEQYRLGCLEFLDFAFKNASIDGMIKCPCNICINKKLGDYETVHHHLLMKGMNIPYGSSLWSFHHEHEEVQVITEAPRDSIMNEEPRGSGMNEDDDDMNGLLEAALYPAQEDQNGEPIPQTQDFFKLLEDANTPLYDGCKEYSKISFLVGLYHIKCKGKMSDETFTEILTLIKKAFKLVNLPDTFYSTKKLVNRLGCGYSKIDVCKNDCMLYWKENCNMQVCKICNESRWKDPDTTTKKIPHKILRHFPVIDRLQRLFMCKKTASDMQWHDSVSGRDDRRSNDGVLRHPADSEAWKDFDKKHTDFAAETRNIRLGLATDGFNPFGSNNVNHSTWPVILMVYNLPPNYSMKREYMIMSLLISGPKGPGNNIDVFLQPLMDELKVLWTQGVMTFDSSCNQYFLMHAALMWTINDFPAYGTLSGWSTSGYLACPVCGENTVSEHLFKSNKQCYMGHNRFVEGAPAPPTGSDVLSQTEGINVVFGIKPPPKDTQWRKRSIFFELPYWKDNLIRHNLDVMHIEKNICENLIRWLLNLFDKHEGYRNATEDIEFIKKPPPGRPSTRFPNLIPKLKAYHKLSTHDKKRFREVLANVKVPDGYASNIKKCFQDAKVYGLKSHDYHILIQVLLPLAIRNIGLPKKMAATILDLCSFFRELCSTSNTPDSFKALHLKIAQVICKFESLFPPSFFVVMLHLSVHLADEARIGGPVQFRWMYPVERYLGYLKSYVRNRYRPEGSIAECYVMDECLTFCSRYLGGVATVHNRPSRHHDGSLERPGLPLFSQSGTVSGVETYKILVYEEMHSAHNYCLFNCDEVKQYIDDYYEVIKERFHTSDPKYEWRIQQLKDKEFRKWIQSQVFPDIDGDLKALFASPSMEVRTYKSMNINGYRFRTKRSERSLSTQNSGVVVLASTSSFTSTSYRRPVEGDVTYYGVINDIIEISFDAGRKVILFDCDWADTLKTKTDSYGFTLVDFTRPAKRVNPYVLPNQVQQVFYTPDPSDIPWAVPTITKPRDNFELTIESAEEEEL